MLIIISKPVCYSQSYNIYFASNSSVLRINDIDKLNELIKNYSENSLYITLTGYTDTVGTNTYNLRLSQQRVNAVKNYLLKHAVPSSSIDTIFHGESDIAGNNGFYNRRVEISIIDKSKKEKQSLTYQQFLNELKPVKQVFNIYADSAIFIEGSKGTLLHIPKNAFEYTNGWEVTGRITLELTEYYSISDYFSNKLTTTSAKGLLSSGGMIYINVFKNGNAVKLKNGVSYEVSFPKFSDNDFQTFYGKRDTNGNMNWEEDSTINVTENIGFTFSLDGSELIITDKKTADENNNKIRLDRVNGGFKVLTDQEALALNEYIAEQEKIDQDKEKYYNILKASKLMYINCDSYLPADDIKTSIKIIIKNRDLEILSVALIYKNIDLAEKNGNKIYLSANGIVEIPKTDNYIYELKTEIPQKMNTKLLVTGIKNGEIYLYCAPVNFSNASRIISKNIELKLSSYNEIKSILRN
jgi:hypothetical protein